MDVLVDIGTRIEIVISEPWDIAMQFSDKPIVCVVKKIGSDYWNQQKSALLARFNKALTYKQEPIEYIIISARYQKDDIKNISSNDWMTSSYVHIPSTRVQEPNPFDLHWWRGGIRLLGSTRVVADKQ